MDRKNNKDWFLRFIKGMFIGSGFILPGVSGGALAAIFGIYEQIISFLANLTKDFKKNVLYFLPVGLGGMAGVFFLSFGVSFLLGEYETIILWFFVGCIVGTIPSLWKEAGKKGREKVDKGIMGITFILSFLFLLYGESLFNGQVVQNTWTWIIAGGLIGLGLIVPGLSPSNFLVYMGMYKAMSDGIKNLDVGVIIPIAIGAIAIVLALSKLMDYIFSIAYAKLFHFILGVVFASTLMIIPTNYVGFGFLQYLLCGGMLLLGALLGSWMSRLEEKYK